MPVWRIIMVSKKKASAKKKSNGSGKEKDKLKLMNLKVTERDRTLLAARAKRYENGNLSAWLRRAGLKYKPV